MLPWYHHPPGLRDGHTLLVPAYSGLAKGSQEVQPLGGRNPSSACSLPSLASMRMNDMMPLSSDHFVLVAGGWGKPRFWVSIGTTVYAHRT
jgi:hypothetical protein